MGSTLVGRDATTWHQTALVEAAPAVVGGARLPVFQEGFRALDADIVTLQETVLTGDVDQAAEMLGDGYQLAQQQDRETGRPGARAGQGVTTASKWPFGRVFEVDLHLTERTDEFA